MQLFERFLHEVAGIDAPREADVGEQVG